jgi:hypothetical protein
MNDLIVQEKLAEWQKAKALVLDSVSSPITRRGTIRDLAHAPKRRDQAKGRRLSQSQCPLRTPTQ